MTHLSTWLAWSSLLWAPFAGESFAGATSPKPLRTAQPPRASWAQEPASPEAPAAVVLAELYELGLQAELIARFASEAKPGGQLAGDPASLALLVRVLFDAGRDEQARALLANPPLDLPTGGRAENTLLILEQARLALTEDDLDLARGLLQAPRGSELPVLYPEQPDAWLLLAKVFARADRLDAAATLAERFLQMAPLHPEAGSAWHLRALDALARGEGPAAEGFLERMRFLNDWHQTVRARRLQIRESPDDPLPIYGLGLAFMRVESWNTAAASFDRLLARFPDYCPGWFQLGEAHRLAGRNDLALGAYSRGADCDPEDLRPLANRGLLLLSSGQAERARRDLEVVAAKAPDDDPDFAPVYLALARELLSDGDELRARDLHARYRALGGSEDL